MMIEKLEAPDGYVFVCVHCAEEIAIKLDDVGKVENNEAHALADELDRVLQVSGCDNRVPRMLRQQADRIAELEKHCLDLCFSEAYANQSTKVTEHLLLKRIAELEKEKIRAYDNGYEDGWKSNTQLHPLSDDDIDKILYSVDWAYDPVVLVRVIEERHGIK
jgi:hypothetical protein